MNRITGLASYDGSSSFIWIQEYVTNHHLPSTKTEWLLHSRASRPADFSYKHDAKHSSTLLVSGMWDDLDDDNAIIRELEEVLSEAKPAAGLAPLHLLRPFFFRLRDKAKLSILHPRILEILKLQDGDHSANVQVPAWPDMIPGIRTEFRTSLAQHLFGWDVLLQLRMRLSFADFTWKHADSEEKQNQCGEVAQALLTAISHRVLRTIIRHLVAAVNLLTSNDIAFVLRMVVQSLLPGSPKDLSDEALMSYVRHVELKYPYRTSPLLSVQTATHGRAARSLHSSSQLHWFAHALAAAARRFFHSQRLIHINKIGYQKQQGAGLWRSFSKLFIGVCFVTTVS
ncbi:hypothetical protein H0H81_001687 [Sphagnurus paluster]|uniref:Uncharacterized protein n=1 Tax=Sphagnurus paluster TaxID=117069 RepID=A0A9P7GPT0_9AGAR|nr:hypothetical protein H0H81_001687 [Sphagnurus paluster]